jgi:hypothetical protein
MPAFLPMLSMSSPVGDRLVLLKKVDLIAEPGLAEGEL